MPQFHLQISWRLPSVTLQPVHWRFQRMRQGLAPCGVGYKGGIDTSPSWSCRRSLDITSLSLLWQNLRGNHLMVGAGCPAKVSTQQPSAHSAWAPARPSPASSVISQKPALTNVPSSEPATRKICHPAKTLPSSLKKKKSCTKVALPFW